MRAGFYIRRRPQYHPALDHVGLAIPPPSFSAAGFYRGTGVEGGFRGLKLGRRNSWRRVSPRRGG